MSPLDINSISQMSDEEIQKALLKYEKNLSLGPVTPETRSEYEKQLKDVLTHSKSDVDNNDLSSNITKPELVLQPKEVLADIYYGLFIPSEHEAEAKDVKKIYTDRNDCLTFLKRFPGSRFKGFNNYDEAFCFSEYGPVVSYVPSTPEKLALCGTKEAPFTPPITGEKASPFRGPKSQELVKFRKAIEQGNVQYFDECINNNPRFLVSSGDTPAILQEGARYNALHIACRHMKSVFCLKILTIVGDRSFFQRLYPDDAIETSERRTAFLVDLYLNTPDKGFNETPLHFACKHGALECVKILLSYSACDKSLLNKYHELPSEVICNRVRNSSNIEELKEKIKALFEDQYYVPVLRDEDNCLAPCVGVPWSPNLGNEPSPPSLVNNQCSPISPMFKVKGYAGPMSPQQADSFYSRWKKSVVPSPSRNPKGKMAALRISDHEKGLERMGRDLAVEFRVDWAEYWEFLGGFINIMSLEGMAKLEEHLRNKYREVIQQRNQEQSQQTITDLIQDLSSCSQDSTENTCHKEETSNVDGNTTRSSLSSIGELCQDMEALRLNVSLSPNPDLDTIPKRPVLESTLDGSFQESPSRTNHCYSPFDDAEEVPTSVTENYNFAVQSSRISSHRLATVLSDVSKHLSSHVGPDFQILRALRNKMKPEVNSLRNILGKCLTFSSGEKLDFGFVHLFLAAKTVEHLMENIALSNLHLLYEMFKLLVGNVDSFEESSSEEEDEAAMLKDISELKERREAFRHFACVARNLEKALHIGIQLVKEGKEAEKINLNSLEECQCPWRHWNIEAGLSSSRKYPVDLKKLNDSINNNSTEKKPLTESGGRFARAHSFLHRVLFGKKEDDHPAEPDPKNDSSSKAEVHQVFESYVKTLSFEEDEDEEKDEGDSGDEEKDDTESFASAVSSFEEEYSLATPEEEIQVYINGTKPSKDDLDVFIAIGGVSVDEKFYPRLSEWLRLVESHSKESRESWPSSCCGHRQPPTASVHTSSPVGNHKEVKKKLFPKSPI